MHAPRGTPINRLDTSPRYAQAVRSGDHLHIGGQLAYENRDGPIQAQAREIFARIDGYLGSVGLGREALVSVAVYFSDAADYEGFNEAWDGWIEPADVPARVCVLTPLIWSGYRIEVTAVAYSGPGGESHD
jgi:enamine deaminase RidA (YjgF/YER057c/UK114 family)